MTPWRKPGGNETTDIPPKAGGVPRPKAELDPGVESDREHEEVMLGDVGRIERTARVPGTHSRVDIQTESRGAVNPLSGVRADLEWASTSA